MKSKPISSRTASQGDRSSFSYSRKRRREDATPTHLDPRSDARRRPASYPSLNVNYSISSVPKKGSREEYELKRALSRAKLAEKRIAPFITKAVRDSQTRLQNVITECIRKWGIKGCGVLDLTFDRDVSWNEAQRCLNSLRTNVLAKRFGKRYVIVCERGEKNGRVHFHIFFHKEGSDWYTGSAWYWHPKKRRYMCNRNQALQDEWEFWRGVLKGYGFGDRVSINPLRNPEAAAKYFSKYVGKGHYARTESMKGKQLIRYGEPLQLMHGAKFSRLDGMAKDRRYLMKKIGMEFGMDVESSDPKQFTAWFGPRWGYNTLEEFRFAGVLSGESNAGKRAVETVVQEAWDRWKVRLHFFPQEGVNYRRVSVACGLQYKLKEGLEGKGLPNDCWEADRWVPGSDLARRAYEELTAKLCEWDEFGIGGQELECIGSRNPY